MLNVETTKEIQASLAQAILIKNELKKKSEELKAALPSSEVLHKNDLLTYAIKKASKAEEQLEISREQIEALEEQLGDANRELESYHQELDACNKEIVRLESELQSCQFSE